MRARYVAGNPESLQRGRIRSNRCARLRATNDWHQFLASVSARAEGPVEVEGGADQGEVSEGLGEVAQGLAARAGLLGIETEMIRVADHLLEQEAGVL